MIIISKKTKPALIKKYNLDPNFTVKTISVLNIPAIFIGFDKDGSDCWVSVDRKIIYIVKQGIDKKPNLQ